MFGLLFADDRFTDMKYALTLRRALSLLIFPVAVSLLTVPGDTGMTSPYFFEVTLRSSTTGIAQLFYDPAGGNDARESNSVRSQVAVVDTPVAMRFPLPTGSYNGFRFDPIDRQGTVAFSGARIVRAGLWGRPDQVMSAVPASRFRAAHHISSLEANGDQIQLVTTEKANDPILMVSLDAPLELELGKTRVALEWGRAALPTALVIWIFVVLIDRLPSLVLAAFRRAWQRMREWAVDGHHVHAIALTAIFATILSCYPVVFAGKSFVSPDNAANLLYEQFPTLPGYETTELENARWADIGAQMWEVFPYSVVESRAIRSHGELPLWNRFNSAGVTLLGQGLSMIGDPLNVGVVLAGATSWAWDVKFVVAKTLFALGLGLTVFTSTGHLPASLTLTFSSVYIGFFAFRFSHPAFFSLAYAPWILYCWLRVIRAPSGSIASQVRWLSALVLANMMVMNSGTAKEAYMLLVSLNLTGALMFLIHKEEPRFKWRKGARVLFAQIAFVMISAPVWVTFLEGIRESWSSYLDPYAIQFSPAVFAGLFDDVFYRQLVPDRPVLAPSANFLILAGLTWTVVAFRQLSADPVFLAMGLSAVVALAMVFGVVPASVITAVPFLRNVVHIHNTFSAVAIIYLVVLAGFGIKACGDRFAETRWRADLALTVIMLGVLLSLYFFAARPAVVDLFFVRYVGALSVAFVAVPVLIRRVVQRHATPQLLVLLAACLIALHWRHGMYLTTDFDDHVMNPKVRVDLQPASPAIESVKKDAQQPFRTVGFDNNLWPGYNAALGVESMYGCDALVNPFYRELMKAIPVEWGWDWRVIVRKHNLRALKPIYDFLNVGRFLASPRGEPAVLPGLELEGRFDFDVYRSDNVWPRAFFTNRLAVYKSVDQFVALIRDRNGRPIAAVQDTVLTRHPTLQDLIVSRPRVVVAATDYQLTTNSTTFTVSAPERGVVALTEAYSEGDFLVTLNGEPATVFRVNHAFKGVEVDAPGTYTVKFEYWPQHLSASLAASGLGLLLLSAWMVSSGVDRRTIRWN
jgi:hypothetical protein